jgi:hypothetical protein
VNKNVTEKSVLFCDALFLGSLIPILKRFRLAMLLLGKIFLVACYLSSLLDLRHS